MLATRDNTPLPHDAQGLTIAHNGIYAAFSRDVVHLSRPDKPWAWPIANRYNIPSPVVAIEATNNVIVVLTREYPYILTGTDPNDMTLSRIDTPHPCLSKHSVVALGNAVVYASHAGLVTIQDVTEAVPTAAVHDWDTWRRANPETLRAAWYKGRYLAVGQDDAFVFSPPAELIGVDLSGVHALWADIRQGRTFAALPKAARRPFGARFAWYDADEQEPKNYQWMSRVFVLPKPTLFGTLVVIAEYAGAPLLLSAEWMAAHALNAGLLAAYEPIGTLSGPVRRDPAGASTPDGEDASMGRAMMGGAPWERRFSVPAPDGAAPGSGAVRVLLYDGRIRCRSGSLAPCGPGTRAAGGAVAEQPRAGAFLPAVPRGRAVRGGGEPHPHQARVRVRDAARAGGGLSHGRHRARPAEREGPQPAAPPVRPARGGDARRTGRRGRRARGAGRAGTGRTRRGRKGRRVRMPRLAPTSCRSRSPRR